MFTGMESFDGFCGSAAKAKSVYEKCDKCGGEFPKD